VGVDYSRGFGWTRCHCLGSRLNASGSHVATRSAKFNKSAEEVWNTITDFAAAPTWREELKSMEQLPDRKGHAVWKEMSDFGPMTYEITEFNPPMRMVTTIADENLPLAAHGRMN